MLAIRVTFFNISIHAPRTGSDPCRPHPSARCGKFQSTLPARGATRAASRRQSRQQFQSTLPARGATNRIVKNVIVTHEQFQSTLPARGATRPGRGDAERKTNFNPRSPHGERPPVNSQPQIFMDISIHAPRTGSDRLVDIMADVIKQFQSTLPARGATSRCSAD